MAVNPQLNPSFRYIANIPQDAAHPTVIAALNVHNAAVVDLQQAIAALAPKINANATTTIIRTAGSGGSRSPIPSPSPSPYPNLGFVNNQIGVTAYTTQQADAGAIIELSDASSIAVTLNSFVTIPFFCFLSNIGTGTATVTPSTGTINGMASITLTTDEGAIVFFDGTDWEAIATTASSGGSGVSSIQGETGAITLTSSGGTVAITTPSSSVINLEAIGGSSGILKGTVSLTWSAGPFFAAASATIPGVTTTMPALLMVPPGIASGTSFPIEQGNLSACVTAPNTVDCLYHVPAGLPSGGPTTFPVIVFT